MKQKLILLLLLLSVIPKVFAVDDFVYNDLWYSSITGATARTRNGNPDTGSHCIYNQRESYTIPDMVYHSASETYFRVTQIGMYSFQNSHALKSISIGQNVKTIGIYAFKNCTALERISIPPNVETVAEGAFSGCTALKSAYFDEGITSLTNNVFQNCSSLEYVSLPETLTTIYSAFKGCSSLRSIVLPPKVYHISATAFDGCNMMQKIVYPAGISNPCPNASYAVAYPVSNVNFVPGSSIYSKDGKILYYMPETGSVRLDIPEGVEEIGVNSCCWNYSLEEIMIPASVKSIGTGAFVQCPDLKTVKTLATVPPSGTGMFDKSQMEKGALYVPAGTKSAYEAAEGWKDWGEIIEYVPVESILIGDGEELTVKDSRTIQLTAEISPADASFPQLAWSVDNPNIATVDENGVLTTIKEGTTNLSCWPVFEPWKRTVVKLNVIPVTFDVTESPLTFTVSEPTDGEYIATVKSFNPYLKLTEVEIPQTVEREGISYTVKAIGDGAFKRTSTSTPSTLEKVTLPPTIETIGNEAFYGARVLKEINLPDGLKTIGNDAFSGSELELETIPATVTSLGEGAFRSCNGLRSLDLPVGLTTMGDYCFAYCKNLETINLPAGLISIGDRCFYECTALTAISLPEGLKRMGGYCFQNCGNLATLDICNTLEEIGDQAFRDCVSLKSVVIPSSVLTMGKEAFSGCTGLEEVDIQASVTELQNDLFTKCSSLKSVRLPETLISMGQGVFSYCTSLESIELPDSLEELGFGCFWGCSQLTTVKLSESLVRINKNCFYECSLLQDVVFPEGLQEIGAYAFYGCNGLTSVVIPNSVTLMGDRTFYGCKNIRSLKLGVGLTKIPSYAFSDAPIEGTLVIPPTVVSVGINAFDDAVPEKIAFGKAYLTNRALRSAPGDIYVTAPEPERLGVYAFYANINTATVYVQDPGDNSVIDLYKNFNSGELKWSEFSDFQPMKVATEIRSDNSDITYDHYGQKIRLEASVYPEDSSLPYLFWFTSDPEVAMVDPDGVVVIRKPKGDVAPGECVITAKTLYNDGPELTFTISPAEGFLRSIEIEKPDNTTIYAGEEIQFSAIGNPSGSEITDVIWSVSDTEAAEIDQNGLLTGADGGPVSVTATYRFEDGDEISDTVAIEVIPPVCGDSNLDRNVTISDAVNVANYAVGNEVERFSFKASDVDESGIVTIADASGVISIFLSAPRDENFVESGAMRKVAALCGDALVIDNYLPESTSEIAVRLDGSNQYVALQADIRVPEGMVLDDVVLGDGISDSHDLISRRIDERTVRLAIFDPRNTSFSSGSGPLFKLNVTAGFSASDDISITNIKVADANAREYDLAASGGQREMLTGIGSTESGQDISIESTPDGVIICNAGGHTATVSAIDGRIVSHTEISSDIQTLTLPAGVYAIEVNGTVRKVIIR